MGTTEPAEPFSGTSGFLRGILQPKSKDVLLNESEKATLKESLEARIRLAAESRRRAQEISIPARFSERARFGSMDWLCPGARKAEKYSVAFARNPERMTAPLLMGQAGSGKTHLLYAIARAVSERSVAEVSAFRDARIAELSAAVDRGDLIRSYQIQEERLKWPGVSMIATDGAELAHELRSSIAGGGPDLVVERHRQSMAVHMGWTAILVIDDVEVMKMGDWLHEEIYRIIDYRYRHSLPTPMATNLSGDELKRQIGDRLARRILDMTEPFILT